MDGTVIGVLVKPGGQTHRDVVDIQIYNIEAKIGLRPHNSL